MWSTPAISHLLVIIRTHDPSEARIHRIIEWARDLKQAGIDTWVSIDESSAPHKGWVRSRIEEHLIADLQEEHDLIRFHEYTEADMLREYPVLEELLEKLKLERCPWWKRWLRKLGLISSLSRKYFKRKLAWGFYAEAINLLVQKLPWTYDTIWVIEDDVGVSGSLSAILLECERIQCDLMASRCVPTMEPDWHWKEILTERYRQYCANSFGIISEFVVRFSRPFLDVLHALSKDGISAWSESSLYSLCKATKGCEYAELPEEFIGEHWKWNAVVTKEMFEEAEPGKFYHALKW